MNVATYRGNHWTHHQSLAGEGDRDRWTFAFDVRGWRLARTALGLLSGWYGLKVAWIKYGRGLVAGRAGKGERGNLGRLLIAACWNLGLLALCVAAGRWWLYFALWMYPVLSLTVLLNVLRTTAAVALRQTI